MSPPLAPHTAEQPTTNRRSGRGTTGPAYDRGTTHGPAINTNRPGRRSSITRPGLKSQRPPQAGPSRDTSELSSLSTPAPRSPHGGHCAPRPTGSGARARLPSHNVALAPSRRGLGPRQRPTVTRPQPPHALPREALFTLSSPKGASGVRALRGLAPLPGSLAPFARSGPGGPSRRRTRARPGPFPARPGAAAPHPRLPVPGRLRCSRRAPSPPCFPAARVRRAGRAPLLGGRPARLVGFLAGPPLLLRARCGVPSPLPPLAYVAPRAARGSRSRSRLRPCRADLLTASAPSPLPRLGPSGPSPAPAQREKAPQPQVFRIPGLPAS